MLEKHLEAKCRKIAKEHGAIFWKFTSPGTKGVPDRVLIYSGGVVFVELKTNTGLSELQKVRIEEIRQRGARAEVVRTVEEFKALLKNEIHRG